MHQITANLYANLQIQIIICIRMPHMLFHITNNQQLDVDQKVSHMQVQQWNELPAAVDQVVLIVFFMTLLVNLSLNSASPRKKLNVN